MISVNFCEFGDFSIFRSFFATSIFQHENQEFGKSSSIVPLQCFFVESSSNDIFTSKVKLLDTKRMMQFM